MQKYSLIKINKSRQIIEILIIKNLICAYCELYDKKAKEISHDSKDFLQFIFTVHPTYLADLSMQLTCQQFKVSREDKEVNQKMIKFLSFGVIQGGWFHNYINKANSTDMIKDLVDCCSLCFLKTN